MILLKLAWRNLVRNYKKSLLLASLISAGMAVLFVGNALFEGTNSGLERTFVGGFTGDGAIGSDSGGTFSLFGNEIPIINNLERISPLYSHDSLVEKLEDVAAIETFTSIVSTPVRMEIGKFKQNIPVFGVDPESYLEVCDDIEVIEGDFGQLAEEGVFLNSVLASAVERKLDRSLKIGDEISFTISSGNSFRVKKVTYQGRYEYSGVTEALERVALADLTSVRYLADYTLGAELSVEDEVLTDTDSFDFDSLFSESSDVVADDSFSFDFEGLEEELSDTDVRDSLIETDSGAWSFILLKSADGKRAAMTRSVKKILDQYKGETEFLSWRRAAGSTALIVFAIQTLFYVGLGFLGLGAMLVIMNALVFSVLERIGEIGTMRSMGASTGFVRILFMLESMIITIGGALFGILIGVILVGIIRIYGIELSNPLMITLFGGTTLSPRFGITGLAAHVLIAMIIGALAWIYPVALAIRVQPASAINKV